MACVGGGVGGPRRLWAALPTQPAWIGRPSRPPGQPQPTPTPPGRREGRTGRQRGGKVLGRRACIWTRHAGPVPRPPCRLSLDGRAKVRRAAQAAVADTLAGLQAAAPALGPASEAVLKLCQRVLPGPEAAAHAAAAAPSKKRAAAEEAIAAAVADALHLLGALKAWIPLLAGGAWPAAAARGCLPPLPEFLPCCPSCCLPVCLPVCLPACPPACPPASFCQGLLRPVMNPCC